MSFTCVFNSCVLCLNLADQVFNFVGKILGNYMEDGDSV